MKVSVLITTFNLEEYVDAAIESVVSQDLPFEWELLIGDDGSTDGTVERIKQWTNRYPNICLFSSEDRKDPIKLGSKAANNRARLLERARGEYIHFLDGDDKFLNKQKIKTQVDLLDNPSNHDCSCVGHNMEVFCFTSQKRYLLTEELRKNRKFTLSQYWPYYYVHTDTLLFRKECKEMMLNSLYKNFLNDNFITFLALQYGKLYYIADASWAQYNQTGQGLWTGHSKMYGTFRNLQIFDLQMKISPTIHHQIVMRHQGDIRYAYKNMTTEYYQEIQPLLINLPSELFPYTLLLAKQKKQTFKDRIEKEKLILKANLSHVVFKTRRALLKIKSILFA